MAQDKKQLVIVVKGLDNPFFEAINQGCQKWNSENADSEYECFYTGPASTSDEAGEAQIIQDMLSKPSTAAIAISPSNAPLHAQTVKSSGTDGAGDDHRRRLHRRGRRRPADLPRHRQLHDGLPHRRVHQGEEAGRRHDLHDRGQPGRRQHPAPRPGHARRALRHRGPRGARRQRGVRRLDRGGGLPGLHQRRRRQGRAGDDRHPRRQPRPRRLRHHGRLAAVRRAAALPRPVQAARRPDRQSATS